VAQVCCTGFGSDFNDTDSDESLDEKVTEDRNILRFDFPKHFKVNESIYDEYKKELDLKSPKDKLSTIEELDTEKDVDSENDDIDEGDLDDFSMPKDVDLGDKTDDHPQGLYLCKNCTLPIFRMQDRQRKNEVLNLRSFNGHIGNITIKQITISRFNVAMKKFKKVMRPTPEMLKQAEKMYMNTLQTH